MKGFSFIRKNRVQHEKGRKRGEGGLGAPQTMGFQEVICMHSGRRNACWELEFNYL